MKKIGLAVFLLSSVLLTGCTQGTTGAFSDPNVDMHVREISVSPSTNPSMMLNDARSAVVGISVDLGNGYAVGSGVAISDGGFIVTNFHVVEGGNAIRLYFADKTTGSGIVVWADAGMDLAILKSSREIPYLSTVSLDEVDVGQDVYAIGTPLTLEFKHTVTKGIVSAMDRTLESGSAYGTSFLQSLVQHDASINPGNSGGPLINSAGKVIGINTLKASEGEGIGFAIPIAIGKIVVEQIKKNGSYETPYIGLFGFDSNLAEVYGESLSSEGVYVVSTVGPAFDAGIKKGDLIVEVDGEKIENMLDLRIALYSKNIGDTIELKFQRGGIIKTVNLKLAKRG